MAYQRIRLVRGDDAGARDLLRRSLQSLSRHKHVAVTARFAQEEFTLGSRDRGRAIFEGLLASYPKRLDLWNVFIDREVKAGEYSAARSLFERLITLELSPRRMKGVFKKFLSFEASHGDAKKAEAVKDKARAYVQSLA
jgi:rRNA biogenesis protein RRP5